MSEPARSPSSLELDLPEGALVVLVGPSGSGKSTFARKHFLATEIISSDFCRGLVSDDESDQTASKDAFDVLRLVTEKRLGAGRLTVVDATSVRSEHRAALLALATRHRAPAVAIVFDLPADMCFERNELRRDRGVLRQVVREQVADLRQGSTDCSPRASGRPTSSPPRSKWTRRPSGEPGPSIRAGERFATREGSGGGRRRNVSVGSAFGVPFPLPGLGGDGWSARPNHPSPRENLVTTWPPRPPAPRRRERPAPSLSCLPSSSRGQRGALRSRYC
ncbi:MAG: hypothetical protein E6G28_00165 [Actinobacteria bacterium]|nr:MAG: hypothetical protein E6G28_00165 [Actinomycetota bacterium]